VFTDGHAIIAISNFFDDLKALDKIDWSIMKATYWNDNDGTGERPRKRQAEFLVYQKLPWDLITEVGVRDQAMADRVAQVIDGASHRPKVIVRPAWYY
jgi:hypothetical protein